MKKKIAFCFSGQARTFSFIYPYFKKNFLDAAIEQGFEYDIFCAIEDDKDAEKIEVLRPTVTKKIRSNEVEKIIIEKYGDFIAKNFNKKYYFYQTHHYSIINGLQQFFKIYTCNELKNQYQKEHNIHYDIVVRLRFDLLFFNKINFEQILTKVNSGIVLNMIPNAECIYDHFAFGNNENMDIYTNMFTNFEHIFKKEILGTKRKIINKIDNFVSEFLKFSYKISFKNKLAYMVIEKCFYMKSVFLVNNGIYFYNYERIVYQNLLNNHITIHDGKIDFLLLRSNLVDNPTILLDWFEFEI